MSKKCAICGADVNLLQSQKLGDGNHICRKTCKKLGLPDFEYEYSDLERVKAHHAEAALGVKLWEQFFAPRLMETNELRKLKRFGKSIFVAEDIGFAALKENRYKYLFWGKTEHICVYRLADLRMYDLEKSISSSGGKKSKTTFFIRFYFRNTEGLYTFRKQFSREKCVKVIKYFDGLFGLETTKSRNVRQSAVGDIKDAFAMAKAAMEEGIVPDHSKLTPDDFERIMAKAGKIKEGDRTKWREKADAAFKEYRD